MKPFAYVAFEHERDWVEVAPTLRALIDILRAKYPNPDYISFSITAFRGVDANEQESKRVDGYQWQQFHDEWLDAEDIPLHWWDEPLKDGE